MERVNLALPHLQRRRSRTVKASSPKESGPMNTTATSAAPLSRRHKSRSSLACLPCRSRHLKCDGVRPYCSRCIVTAQQCQYAQSRRGGLDRAALAERRKRLEATGSTQAESESADILSPLQSSWVPHRHRELPPPPPLSGDVGADITNDYDPSGESSTNAGSSTSSPRVDIGDDIEGDSWIASYYKNFHKFHPLVLPQKHLIRIHRTRTIKLNLRPLVAVLRLIGHIYSAREWSTSLRDHVETCFAEASHADPIMVQCRTLYSIALFWNNYKDESKREMDAAVRLALDLQMFRQDFAAKQGSQDAVLTECWRRTWWTLYMVDAFYAGTLGTMNFATVDVVATVDLPSEEWEYEEGQIPEPKTLQDFDCRDLAPESTSFSSFAYLIGAVRCAALAISTAPKVATSECSQQILQAADAVINGWLLLLPKGRKQVMSKTGELDELMFQAHLLIHVATVGLHRPLSDLKFNPIEWISSCARAPPREIPTPELINVHTVRVLKSTEAQIRLLALPTTEQFHHSPFTTCMVSEGTLALLSGCKFLFKGKELAVARDQIRMTIGCLKVLGELWPRTAKNVQEIQIIARHVLGLGNPRATEPDNSVPGSSEVPSLSSSDQGQTTNEGPDDVDPSSSNNSDIDIFASLGSMEDVCGWYNNNSSDFGQDPSWWTETTLS